MIDQQRTRRMAAIAVALVLLLPTWSGEAHEIPADVTVRIERAETNVSLARQTLELGRLQFDAGDVDLVSLNIYEKAVTDAQLLKIAAQADFFSAVADYRAALARNP